MYAVTPVSEVFALIVLIASSMEPLEILISVSFITTVPADTLFEYVLVSSFNTGVEPVVKSHISGDQPEFIACWLISDEFVNLVTPDDSYSPVPVEIEELFTAK